MWMSSFELQQVRRLWIIEARNVHLHRTWRIGDYISGNIAPRCLKVGKGHIEEKVYRRFRGFIIRRFLEGERRDVHEGLLEG